MVEKGVIQKRPAPAGNSLVLAELGERRLALRRHLDNRATTDELVLLAGVYRATKREQFRDAFFKGLDYIFDAQFPNGGWPQVYPLEGGYHDAVTYNDDAMIHVLDLLRDIANGTPEFKFVDDARRAKARKAVAAGLQCILDTQVMQNNRRTVWCAQHDPLTLAPCDARLKEPASLSGGESVGIVKFLMQIPNPSPEIVRAIEDALVWFEHSKLTGLRPTQRDGRSFFEKDPTATQPYWARFYDIATNRPVFAGAQDGILYDSFEEMWKTNHFGYDFYTKHPEDLITKDQAKWRKLLAKSKAGK